MRMHASSALVPIPGEGPEEQEFQDCLNWILRKAPAFRRLLVDALTTSLCGEINLMILVLWNSEAITGDLFGSLGRS